MMQPIYLLVDGIPYYNELLARYVSYQTGKPVKFICYSQEKDLLNWLVEPSESLDELMLAEAIRIRNSVEYLILSWSGGTDSNTIYNIFVRNNIHIDEIVVWYDEVDSIAYPKDHAEWLVKNHPDPTTIISPRDRFDPESKSKMVNNDDWIWQNTAMIARLNLAVADVPMQEYCQKQSNGRTWCLLNGQEQPEVYSEDGLWYATHNTRTYRNVMGFDNSICFYALPKLTLKQAHMAKTALKIMGKTKIGDGGWTFGPRTPEEYQYWATCIGRHSELNLGRSYQQKRAEVQIDYLPIKPDSIDGELTAPYDSHLTRLIQQDHSLVKTFQNGIRNVLYEKDFCDYLIETSTRSNINVVGKNVGAKITSKRWCLGQ